MSILPHQLGEGRPPKELRYSTTDPLEDMGAAGATGLLKDLMLCAHAEGVQALFERMTNMPWAAHFTRHALRVLANNLATRAEVELDLEETDRSAVREDVTEVASELHDAESFSPFPRGALVVVDLNRSSAFFYSVKDEHRARLDESLQTAFGTLMKETGVQLVQKPAGDQYAFFVEYSDNETDNAARLQEFMAKLDAIRIPTGLNGRDYDRMGLNTSHYPNNQFTMATGVYECEAGDLQAGVFMGSKDSIHGYTAILGKGMAAGIELQKTAGPGQTRYCPKSEDRKKAKIGEYTVVPRPKEPLFSLLDVNPRHMQAQLLTLFRTLHHPSGLEPEAKKLGATYVALKVGDAVTVAEPERYAQVAEVVFSVLEQSQFQGFSISKQDFTMLHFEVDERHRFDQDLVLAFCNELLARFEALGLVASAGVAHADAMLTTRYRNSIALDRSSPAIVEAVRCAALAPEGQIACGRSALGVWGEHVEHDVKHLKEGPLFYALNRGKQAAELNSKGLEGVDEELTDLRAFCFSKPRSPEVLYALGVDEPLKGKGPGVSALFRQLQREVPSEFEFVRIPNVGNGGYGYIRGLLQSLGLPTEGDETAVMAQFDRMLLEADWGRDRVLVLDTPRLSAEEEEAFSRLLVSLAGTGTKLLCTQGAHVETFKTALPVLDKDVVLVKERALRELSPESACRLIMDTRPDLTPDDHDPLMVALAGVRAAHPDLPFTPRHVLHVYAPALYKAGAELLFNGERLESVRAGDLGVDLREDGVSVLGRRILGVLGHSRRSQWNLNTLHAFYNEVTGEGVDMGDFEKEIAVLRGKYLRNEPILIALKGRYAMAAQDLFMPDDPKVFSQTLLQRASFKEDFSADEEEALAEWTHLSKSLDVPNERLRELTSFLARAYVARGLRNEARRLYADYFHQGLMLTGSDKPLLLDALWLFADGEDPVCWEHAKELAEPLLGNLYLQADFRLELIWRLYRIAMKENSNHANLEVLLHAQGRIAELNGQAFLSVPAKEGDFELRNQVLKALSSSALFYKLKTMPPPKRRAADEQDALKADLARDQAALTSMPMHTSRLGREVSASSKRLLAGRYKLTYGGADPQAHEAAKGLFASARSEFERLDGTMRADPRQKRDCMVFENEADMYLLNIRLASGLTAEPDAKRTLRKESLGRLGPMFAEGLEVYKECCLKGDRLNRRAASAHLGNLLILEVRARSLDLQEGDEERIVQLIPEIRKYWAHFSPTDVEDELRAYLPAELYSRVAM